MDLVKIGAFLTQLRKEHDLTQAQLGQKLGVTNKTVSRWETGTYLPPVECLQMMSQLYGITINEILSAQRLTPGEYRQKAEENLTAAVRQSSFSLQEKIRYFEKKWDKDHRFELTASMIVWSLAIGAGVYHFAEGVFLLQIGVIIYVLSLNNRKKAYVEDHAYDGSGNH